MIVLPVVLYGCETWSLTLRKEYRSRLFENRILRRIFGPKRDENGKWRRFHNEELLLSNLQFLSTNTFDPLGRFKGLLQNTHAFGYLLQ
jgi:hypothetical protein